MLIECAYPGHEQIEEVEKRSLKVSIQEVVTSSESKNEK
jgi:hypothetical protein